MPSKPRSKILFDNCTTHKVWRGHNKEFVLATENCKETYLLQLKESIDLKIFEDISLNALCIMGNHTHEMFTIGKVQRFSNLMRRHHSKFGIYYNRLNKRSGKVAESRPHTTCFEEDEFSMEAVFYVHANPLRANIIKDERGYAWSTHMLYAYGKLSSALKKLNLKFKFPKWYIELGKTSKERQARYRKLFAQYRKNNSEHYRKFSKILFVGNARWEIAKNESIQQYLREMRERLKEDILIEIDNSG